MNQNFQNRLPLALAVLLVTLGLLGTVYWIWPAETRAVGIRHAIQPTDSQGTALDEAPPDLITYRPRLQEGERLVYDIRWSGVPAGRAELVVHWLEPVDGAQAYLISASARANQFVSQFYPVHNEVRSLLDAQGGFSRYYDSVQREGRLRVSERVHFDYVGRQARYRPAVETAFGAPRITAVKLAGPVQDPLSCLYALRGLDLPQGSSVRLRVHTCRRDWSLTVHVRGQKTLDLGRRLGTFRALRLEPDFAFPGLFARRGPLVVYVEEATHIPLLLEAETPIGPITATLTLAENSPLDAHTTQPIVP